MSESATNRQQKPDDGRSVGACGTNSTLNTTIGVLALIAAGIIGYVVYRLIA